MKSSASFYVFPKWKGAKTHAFGSHKKASAVPLEDKTAYRSIYEDILAAATRARQVVAGGDKVELKLMNFSPEYGSRGHRPVDLWISLCGENSQALGQMPQIYAIASERGLEVGFAVSIDEADYHDPNVKARNRIIVPLLNSKLPDAESKLTGAIERLLESQGGWHFNTKARLNYADQGFDHYKSLAEMIIALKNSSEATGGGTICRLFKIEQLAEVDLNAEFELALQNFLPLIARCAPTPWDVQIVETQDVVKRAASETSFEPATSIDARQMVLTEIARRQGQEKFRKALLKAYGGRCAISGTSVPSVLQAAHITPYLGPHTNHVTNGLLLRADLHTLFDLHLIRIEPTTLKVIVSDSLRNTPYAKFEGRTLGQTAKPSERPSQRALEEQFKLPAI